MKIKNSYKITGVLLGMIAGVWLLSVTESLYYYVKFQSYKDSLNIAKNEVKITVDTVKPIDKLKYWVDELGSNDSVSHGTFGFCLATADSGKIIYEYNADRSLCPASSLKIVTTGVALTTVGGGYSFPTILQYSGNVNPATRTLNGNIYIRGSGDPTLGSNNFGCNTYYNILQRWLLAIRNLGIDSINGSIIGDGEIFDYDAIPGGWAWEDVELDYGAAPSGLSFRDNCYDIRVTAGGGAYIDPPVPEIKALSSVIFNGGIYNSYAYAAGPPFSPYRLLRGEVRYAGTFCAPVSDPAYFCAYSLYRYLEKNKIHVSDSATTVRRLKILGNNAKPERKSIHTTYSPSVAGIVHYTNHVSQNMYAETLLKLISVVKNSYGSTLGGVNAIYKYWSDKNIDMRGFYMCDGSGLSRANAVTPRQLTYMLVSYANDSVIFRTFYNSLPVYGKSVLANDTSSTPIAKLNIHAKGGYMSRVRSLVGYIRNKNNKLLVFSMIINNQEFAWFNLMSRFERILRIISQLE